MPAVEFLRMLLIVHYQDRGTGDANPLLCGQTDAQAATSVVRMRRSATGKVVVKLDLANAFNSID